MTEIGHTRKLLTQRMLRRRGAASPRERRAALETARLAEPLMTLSDKIATNLLQITSRNIVAARNSDPTVRFRNAPLVPPAT
jgi:hypothetical protein